MIKLFMDLDGVIRDLEKSVFNGRVNDWNQKTPNGMEFFDYIEYKGLQLVDEAKPTKFYKAIYDFYNQNFPARLTFLTHQPEQWKKYTTAWIARHFRHINYEVLYVDKMMGKVKYLENAVLFDDYPGFAGNPNVIMVNKTYNQFDSAPHIRVSKVVEMKYVLEYLFSDKACLGNLYKDLNDYVVGAYSCLKL